MFDNGNMRSTLRSHHPRRRHDAAHHNPSELLMPSDPDLEALLAALVNALEAARVAVDDLARDLASSRWKELLPPRHH